VARQNFNIGWYVNKPPEFNQKPVLIEIDADYDKIQDGSQKRTFVYKSPVAIDAEKNKILMTFTGLEGIPC
jgi:hypothetical protein